MEFLGKLGLIGQLVGVLALGLIAIIIIANDEAFKNVAEIAKPIVIHDTQILVLR